MSHTGGPLRLWDTNAFYPDCSGLAFNDTLLGYAPARLIGDGVDAAVLRYNVVFVLVFALAAVGAYALARQLGANRVGAGIAGAAFAYAPWRYGHEGHLNILSTGGLAFAGLLSSVWTVRQRICLAAGIGVGVLFSLGTNGPMFRLLYDHLPGFDGSRTPGRLIVWPTLLLGILAAGFVTDLGRRVPAATIPDARSVAVRVVTVPLLLGVLIEGLPKMDHIRVPPAPAAMAGAPAPLIVLPSDDSSDLNVMLWSTDGFPVMANGASSVVTPVRQELRDILRTFPSQPSVTRLRELGIRSVVVVRERAVGSPYEAALHGPIDGLGLTRRPIGPDLLYTIG